VTVDMQGSMHGDGLRASLSAAAGGGNARAERGRGTARVPAETRERVMDGCTIQYAAKHAIAAIVVICSMVVLTAISYLGLLAWAVLADAPIGGPLAFPFMLLLALVLSIAAVLAVLWPVTSLTEAMCRGLGYRQTLLQIPIAALLLFVEVASITLLIALVRHQPADRSVVSALTAGVVLLVPLGIYWWSLQAANWLIGICGALWRWPWKRTNTGIPSGR